VAALIRHGGEHAMADVSLSDGTVVYATAGHPFWDASAGAFVTAGALPVGDEVLTAGGARLSVTAVVLHEQDLTAYNLSIEGIHTYYAGDAAVLVHNTGAACQYSSFSSAKRGLGSPGNGNVYDHVVEQSQIKRSGFSPEQIHSSANLNPVSAQVNQLKANWYSRSVDGAGSGTIRDWLSGQSFEFQFEYGMKVTKLILEGLG
jgi:hypothetical protein